MNDFSQEHQVNVEEARRGIKPFEAGIAEEEHRSDYEYITSVKVLSAMGKLFLHIERNENDYLHDYYPHSKPSLGIDDKGILTDGADIEFYKKGYYHFSVHLENPRVGPQPDLKFNIWKDNDQHVLSQVPVESDYGNGEDWNIYVAQWWGKNKKALWVSSNMDLLKQINISVESIDPGGEV